MNETKVEEVKVSKEHPVTYEDIGTLVFIGLILLLIACVVYTFVNVVFSSGDIRCKSYISYNSGEKYVDCSDGVRYYEQSDTSPYQGYEMGCNQIDSQVSDGKSSWVEKKSLECSGGRHYDVVDHIILTPSNK